MNLARALANNELTLYFQPQLRVKDGLVNRMEALMRWHDPVHGTIHPAAFIPLAEETGMIVQLGEWALLEACRLMRKWLEAGYQPVTVAVNISPKHFAESHLVQMVRDALLHYQLDPACLELELTESTLIHNVDAVVSTMYQLRELGVTISIDDFGVGCTSLNYLRQYPVNMLKIDRAFIMGLPGSRYDAAITSSVISLGHKLGLQVIAEGVETAEQMQFLRTHQCDFVQGYLISKPLPDLYNRAIERSGSPDHASLIRDFFKPIAI